MQNEGPLSSTYHPEPVASAFKVTERLLKLHPSFLRSWQQEEGRTERQKASLPPVSAPNWDPLEHPTEHYLKLTGHQLVIGHI